MKKALEETQTLCAGGSKNFHPTADPFPGPQDGQNLISWRRSLPLPTDRVWWRSMHAISSYRGNRPTNKHKLTGPIAIHCAAASLARSVNIYVHSLYCSKIMHPSVQYHRSAVHKRYPASAIPNDFFKDNLWGLGLLHGEYAKNSTICRFNKYRFCISCKTLIHVGNWVLKKLNSDVPKSQLCRLFSTHLRKPRAWRWP